MGKLIVLEGLDGSGKSTQVKKIKEYFTEKEFKYEFFHFPMYGHNQFSDLIARFLRGELGNIDEVDPVFVANMYAMDRFKFLPELSKALNENDVVLLDRYVYSNIAFQCAKVKEGSTNGFGKYLLGAWIKDFEFNCLDLPYPDLNVFFDVPMDVIKERLIDRSEDDNREYLNGKQDIHEADLDYQSKVRDEYLRSMTDRLHCTIVNTVEDGIVLTPEEVFNKYEDKISLILQGLISIEIDD